MWPFRRHSIIGLIYIIIGIFVASDHHYLNNLDSLARVVSAILAIALWPLVLFDANLHVHF
jgi:uncharacterized membrane protein YesL